MQNKDIELQEPKYEVITTTEKKDPKEAEDSQDTIQNCRRSRNIPSPNRVIFNSFCAPKLW
jgi:hypothetical protein